MLLLLLSEPSRAVQLSFSLFFPGPFDWITAGYILLVGTWMTTSRKRHDTSKRDTHTATTAEEIAWPAPCPCGIRFASRVAPHCASLRLSLLSVDYKATLPDPLGDFHRAGLGRNPRIRSNHGFRFRPRQARPMRNGCGALLELNNSCGLPHQKANPTSFAFALGRDAYRLAGWRPTVRMA